MTDRGVGQSETMRPRAYNYPYENMLPKVFFFSFSPFFGSLLSVKVCFPACLALLAKVQRAAGAWSCLA